MTLVLISLEYIWLRHCGCIQMANTSGIKKNDIIEKLMVERGKKGYQQH